jgi:hypothetical protein
MTYCPPDPCDYYYCPPTEPPEGKVKGNEGLGNGIDPHAPGIQARFPGTPANDYLEHDFLPYTPGFQHGPDWAL